MCTTHSSESDILAIILQRKSRYSLAILGL
nr:MAG TPA: hypothetical protein [Caudoviricetes sp.]DAT53644.1 MAG TPA: hypothetical protein [Caudoviricetes sp.]